MRRLRAAGDFAKDGRGESVVAYTFRHSAATEAVQAGLSSLTLAELMGHSDVRQTQRYVHLVPEHLISAMGALESFRRGKKVKTGRVGSRRKHAEGEG